MKFSVLHDLHCHTGLSSCSADPKMTPQAILDHAESAGYDLQAITDHLWDNAVPGASDWYRPQDVAHVCKSLPLPKGTHTKFIFGCETEYCGHGKLGLSPENFDKFQMIIIPPNHFHMRDFVRDSSYDTPQKVADLLLERLEEISRLDVPWKKIGIAHLNDTLLYSEGNCCDVIRLLDEDRMNAVFQVFAAHGAGIELNSCSFENWKEDPEAHLRIFRAARDAGCRFYCGSDAHHLPKLEPMSGILREVADALELTEENRFIPAFSD